MLKKLRELFQALLMILLGICSIASCEVHAASSDEIESIESQSLERTIVLAGTIEALGTSGVIYCKAINIRNTLGVYPY